MTTWDTLKEAQPLAVQILTNSIKKDRVSHAYLIQGARGTGKRALAVTLVKSIFCENRIGVEPCQTCQACVRIESTNHPDVHFIEPDGQTIKIEQIRHLQKEFTYSGMESNQKAYIVEGAETLTLNAANRILKFLEEPSQKTTALLLTENGQAIIPTIRSRCQSIDLQPLDAQVMLDQLLESDVKEESAVTLSMLTSDLNEALSLYEEKEFAEKRRLAMEWIKTLSLQEAEMFTFIHQHWLTHFTERADMEIGLDLLLIGLKDLLYELMGDEKRVVLFQNRPEERSNMALRYTQEVLLQHMNAVLVAKRELKQNVHPTLAMEKLALQVKR